MPIDPINVYLRFLDHRMRHDDVESWNGRIRIHYRTDNLNEVYAKTKREYYIHVSLVSAALAAIVAWRQLNRLNNTVFADLLTKVENRYGSPEILEARRIIHHLYLVTKLKNNDCGMPHQTNAN